MLQVVQEEEAGLHNVVEENAFTADDDGFSQSPAPYLVRIGTCIVRIGRALK